MRKHLLTSRVPVPGQGKRGEGGHLGYLLRQANAAFRGRLERSLADFGVTQPQFAVLTMIAAYPECSGADLARLSLLAPQTVSVIVANLKRDGLLDATAHPVHGRIQCLSLTAQGRKTLERCKARVQLLEEQLVTSLSESEEVTVRRWLTQVAMKGSP